MSSFLKKHRELLVVGFLLSFAFLSYASRAGKSALPGPIRRTVVWLGSPIERGIVWTADKAQDLWSGYVDLRHVRDVNQDLRTQVIRLQLQQEQVAEVRSENDRLRKMASFAESVPEMRLIAASVIAVGVDPKLRSIRIGRGSADGLHPGMPVITPDGVVGRVTQVYERAADVLLIIDPTSAVAAYTQRTRSRATARGTGDPSHLRLDFIVKSDDIESGDILLTAASGGLFPKGLKLGVAVHVKDNQSAHGLFKAAELVPAVDFNRLDEVQVVVNNSASASLDRPRVEVFQ